MASTSAGRRRRLMARLLLVGARDPWVLLLSGLGGGGAWAVGVPVMASAGVGLGMTAVGAVATVLTGNAELPERSAPDPTLRPGTEQADLVAALDGYLSDLSDLRASQQPPAVVDPTIQALAAARDSRGVALGVAAAIDNLEQALARSERVNRRWSGSTTSAGIAQSMARMRTRRDSLLATLTRTVGEIAEVYTKLLEVSASVDTVALHDGSVLDIKSIDSSLDSLRSAVAKMESDQRTAEAEVLGEL